MFLWISRIVCFLPLNIMHPTFIKGKENLPKGKAILSCNHYSNWDMALYYLNISEKYAILGKKELEKKFVLGKLLKDYGGIFIDREGSDLKAIKECFKALKEDKKLFVFPEGTRLKDKSKLLGELKSGMAMISIKSKTPIVPIWIENRPRLFRPTVYHIGKPFELEEFYGQKLDEETLKKANEIVRGKMLELRQEIMDKKAEKKNKKKKKTEKV